MPSRPRQMIRPLGFGLALLSGAVVGFFALAWISAGLIYDYEDTFSIKGPLPQIDVIVCLAGARGRIEAAGETWYQYWKLLQGQVPVDQEAWVSDEVPTLYVSGMGPQANWLVFSKQLREDVRKALTEENVILETQSTNTDENAQWLARYVKENGWNNILLITSSYHMKRAKFIFQRVLESAVTDSHFVIYTQSVDPIPFSSNQWRSDLYGIRVTLIEYLKWIYYRFFWEPKPLKVS